MSVVIETAQLSKNPVTVNEVFILSVTIDVDNHLNEVTHAQLSAYTHAQLTTCTHGQTT